MTGQPDPSCRDRQWVYSPTDGVHESAQRLPHTQAAKLAERPASASRAQRAGMSAYLEVNRVAPGSIEEGRERKRVTAPSHGAVWRLSSRLGSNLRHTKVTLA